LMTLRSVFVCERNHIHVVFPFEAAKLCGGNAELLPTRPVPRQTKCLRHCLHDDPQHMHAWVELHDYLSPTIEGKGTEAASKFIKFILQPNTRD
jgi:hypothetical protein